MHTFWKRFVRLNAPLIAATLRKAADEVEHLFPGSPAIGFLIFDVGGKLMLNPTIPDNAGPITGTILWVDAENNPTTPDANETPSVSVDNPAVGDATIADDKTTITFSPTGALGAAVVTASVTNESGASVTVQGTVTVVASDLVAGSIDFQVPEPPVPPAPPEPTP